MKYDLKIPYSDIIKMEFEVKEIDRENIENFKTAYPFDKENCKKIFEKVLPSGKISNFEIFLIWFPDFYFNYKNTFDTIFYNKDGYLPLTWKIYLGIMAASTIRSEYLLRKLEGEFLFNGGDEDWLILGLEGVPEKLQNLQILNNILAHQPWKLNEKDIKNILNNNNYNNSNSNKTSFNSYNIEDLMESVIILTTFHRLCTVLESLKIDVKKSGENSATATATASIKENQKDLTFNSNQENFSEGKESSEESKESSKDLMNFSKSVDLESSLSFIINEEGTKSKIINTLEMINKSNEGFENKKKCRKNSENNASNGNKLFDNFHNNNTNEIIVNFSKYISNYCTVYLDFDNYSEDYKSYFVKEFYFIFFFILLIIYF